MIPEKTAASATQKFILTYTPGVWFNNRIIANQETFIGNNHITKLNIHNLLYFGFAMAIFFSLNEIESLNSSSIGLAFTLSAILACLVGEIQFALDPNYQNSIFNHYPYKPKLTLEYEKKINKTGWGIFFQYGFQNFAFLIFILAATMSKEASEATGTLSQLFSIYTVNPQQVIQALASAYILSLIHI